MNGLCLGPSAIFSCRNQLLVCCKRGLTFAVVLAGGDQCCTLPCLACDMYSRHSEHFPNSEEAVIVGKQISALWTIAGLSSASGGPTRSVLTACDALASEGLKVAIFSVDNGLSEGHRLLPGNEQVGLRMVRGYPLAGWLCGFVPGFGTELLRYARTREAAIMHDNGLWLFTNYAAAKVALANRIPLVVSTRGMLAPWALQYHRLRKQVAWHLYQRRVLVKASLLHVTSEAEAEQIRAKGLVNPIAVIPNPVNTQRSLPPRQRETGNRRVLFLGRLHPVKGLENLLEAWSRLRPMGWELVIAGPDEDGYRARLEAMVTERRLEATTSFRGAVDEGEKWSLYRSADLFVLPSHTENFGMVIAEALSCEVPVIATHGSPWPELVTFRCGWHIQTGVDPLVRALVVALGATDLDRQEMGSRGRQFVQERYSMSRIATEMKSVYEWLLGRVPKPASVRLG